VKLVRVSRASYYRLDEDRKGSGFLPWRGVFGAARGANLLQHFCKHLIMKELVAVTGVEPGFSAF
jgi:hypothetical protein